MICRHKASIILTSESHSALLYAYGMCKGCGKLVVRTVPGGSWLTSIWSLADFKEAIKLFSRSSLDA